MTGEGRGLKVMTGEGRGPDVGVGTAGSEATMGRRKSRRAIFAAVTKRSTVQRFRYSAEYPGSGKVKLGMVGASETDRARLLLHRQGPRLTLVSRFQKLVGWRNGLLLLK